MKTPIHHATILAILVGYCYGTSAAAASNLPVRGRPVPEFAHIEPLVQNWMAEADMNAAVIGIMRNDRTVYLRGFGWLDEDLGIPMIENAKVRLASVVKPMTAAAIHELVRDPGVNLGLNTRAFNLGQAGGGVLNLNPWPSLGDPRLGDVTIDHMLGHKAGWDRDSAEDHTSKECHIADAMNVASPPGRPRTMRWILGQPLIHEPGTLYKYSNEGYMALGLIIDELAPQGYLNYLRQRILTPAMGVPATEISRARTLRENADRREPWYLSGTCRTCNVFTGCSFSLFSIQQAYGSRDLEARLSHGGIKGSAAAALTLANHYQIGRPNQNFNSIGQRLVDAPLTTTRSHGGDQSGVSTLLLQQVNGVRVFIFFNRNVRGVGINYTAGNFWTTHLRDELAAIAEADWPTRECDGFWIQTGGSGSGGYGAYNQPFASFGAAIANTSPGSTFRLFPGSSDWTGEISGQLELDAPFGMVTIGQ